MNLAGSNTLLSPHFFLSELTLSEAATRRGIGNVPTPLAFQNLKLLAERLELVRSALGGVPILISSGYRSPAVNVLVGGSVSSAHTRGCAVDFTAPAFGTPYQVCAAIERAGIAFDQLIYEGTWVHLGIEREPGKPAAAGGVGPRGQVLTAVFKRGQPTTYLPGLVA